jgi:hypothetical protein
VVLLQEAEDTTSLLRLLAQLLIRNALALGTEIFLEPQGIGSGYQKLNMSFDFGSLESDGGTGIAKLQDLARQRHGVVNWKKYESLPFPSHHPDPLLLTPLFLSPPSPSAEETSLGQNFFLQRMSSELGVGDDGRREG